MITRTYIVANLNLLDRKFRSAQSQKESLLYSKLAILELCGWIEESMDDVIMRCAIRKLRDPANRKFVEKQIVERNFGFEYEKHFRRMLIQLVGLISVEKIERQLDSTKIARLKATLGSLKVSRNTEAHTHIRGITRSINAPSVTRNQLELLYEGLIEYQNAVRSI